MLGLEVRTKYILPRNHYYRPTLCWEVVWGKIRLTLYLVLKTALYEVSRQGGVKVYIFS